MDDFDDGVEETLDPSNFTLRRNAAGNRQPVDLHHSPFPVSFHPQCLLAMNLLLILLPLAVGGAQVDLTIANSGDYAGEGSFAVVPPRGTYAYLSAIRRDYKFRLVNAGSAAGGLAGTEIFWPMYYQIDIRINPCVNVTLSGGLGAACCAGTGEVNCQDSTVGVAAGEDLQIAYIQNAHISNCIGTDFEDDPNCGTYIEIHRGESIDDSPQLADDVAAVLAGVPLTNTGGGYQTVYIGTGNLCSGPYELWWVVRTRSGPYVQHRKPFDVLTPSCAV